MTLCLYESQDPIHRAKGDGFVLGMKVPQAYKELNKSLTLERILIAFSSTLGLPRAAVSTKFKEVLVQALDEFPDMRCSAVRALIEGRIPGVPQPFTTIPYAVRRNLEKALYLMDCFETIIQLHFQRLAEQDKKKEKVADQVFEKPEETKERRVEERLVAGRKTPGFKGKKKKDK